MRKRESGVLMHISSLPGDYSIGEFSEHAKYFVDFLADCGFTYWQVLPFCMVDECNSPYKSYSAFAGNPYFVDLQTLQRKGLLREEELAEYRQQTPYSSEYVRLYHTRNNILRLASERVHNKEEIRRFIAERPYLEQFCRFMALKEANGQKCWHDWENERIDKTTLFMWQFIQYEFFTQWKDIKEYANSRGVKIIGDLPVYVSYDSVDVWANKDLFQLDDAGNMTHVAGVPPDYFSQDGQLWGNPLYNWEKMQEDGFSWWQDRLSHMFSMFDGVRIDHFRAIESYYSVDATAENARNGKWIEGPGREFVDMVNAIRGDNLIIAEDLGDITDAVRDLVDYSGFPCMRVLQFGFLDDNDTIHKPHHYHNNCVAYTGTHDNNTLLGYVWELDDVRRRELLEYCGYTNPDWNQGYDSILRTMFMSHAGILILPIQDLLGYGSDTRLNIPGKADGNWQFRVTKEQLEGIDREKFKRFNALYRR
ncbi:MAG: 4-alpha-glucanotransferase [Clostridia bacterium]|nr:4-alpha-glucanotransferase [Clostridia bacterium]